MKPATIGIIGCGVISDAYLKGAARSPFVNVKAVSDLRAAAAEEKSRLYGCLALTLDELLSDPDIEIVVNLTIPAAHAEIDRKILAAGKHVYSEKPFVVDITEAQPLLDQAARQDLRIGCAPDTFLGAGHQACRRAIDQGTIGRVIGGSVTIATRGMEHWHPDPRFFYKLGGGPHFDIGPYYITQLVNLLGPVTSVSAITTRAFETRTITSEALAGTEFPVEVPTTINGTLLFASGANVALTMSWDVYATRKAGIEIYGTEGSLFNPDPNFFGGVPEVSVRGGAWEPLPIDDLPFGVPNRTNRAGKEVADYRMVGLVDMAIGIRDRGPHRASGALAAHVQEVLTALERSSEQRAHIEIVSTVERPAVVGSGAGEEVLLTAGPV